MMAWIKMKKRRRFCCWHTKEKTNKRRMCGIMIYIFAVATICVGSKRIFYTSDIRLLEATICVAVKECFIKQWLKCFILVTFGHFHTWSRTWNHLVETKENIYYYYYYYLFIYVTKHEKLIRGGIQTTTKIMLFDLFCYFKFSFDEVLILYSIK